MRFTKMHGAGNDYIYVDCFAQEAPERPSELAVRMSDRHFGVGSDGLILICPSERADAQMRMFNADGSAAEMCGNGIRCIAKYVYEHGIARRDRLRIESAGRLFTLDVHTENGCVRSIRVDMGEPILDAARIPTTLTGNSAENRVVERPLDVAGRQFPVTCVSMGNPHCIIFLEEAEELADELVLGYGPLIENDQRFPMRTNVEFVKIASAEEVIQRTWERGSGETLACGTGASAVCVAGVLTGRTKRTITNHLRGGDLTLEWSEADNHVYMTGPAEEVFTGEWPERRR
jgi:diaminopimelate epimerase